MNTKYLHIAASIGMFIFACPAFAEESKIYQTESTGNIQYHKPSYVVQSNGRVIEADSFGNKQHHKQQYQMKGDRIYQTDKFGNIQYHKLYGVIKK
ncbi:MULTISPECIES: hypothetical protein [unclassified Methylophilus]|uniref:hypothetical protein n=1 Tax=unclassified Methylophilus TaxID=2630143 RepID=UPI0006F69DCE|nr:MULTISPECIES: hypothetical protein [unclassified Methylophilus]KQT42514.1 hypothetical protein ASG34_07160 [Methylophilus sp. Leaf416]KQT56697.1 hypothetical protein ASG44_07135 [Methylophilus sp. Leaf459]